MLFGMDTNDLKQLKKYNSRMFGFPKDISISRMEANIHRDVDFANPKIIKLDDTFNSRLKANGNDFDSDSITFVESDLEEQKSSFLEKTGELFEIKED